jgi:hypothetical protein
MHSNGTHPLQHLISRVSIPEEELILRSEIEPHILDLAIHPSGSRVVLTMLNSLKSPEFIERQVLDNFDILARNQHAICLIKQIFKVSEPSLLEDLLEGSLLDLAQDPYGNYAIQDAIKNGSLPESLYPTLIQNMVTLAGQKFSSNVIERIIEMRPGLILPALLESVITKGLIGSHFGFFVAKKALQLGDSSFVDQFKSVIETVIDEDPGLKNALKWNELVQGSE